MDNVLLDQLPCGIDMHRTAVGSCGRFGTIRSAYSHGIYSSPYSSISDLSELLVRSNNGMLKSPTLTPTFPPIYYPTPTMHSSTPSLLPIQQPPLLPLPPQKYSTFASPSPPPCNNKAKSATVSAPPRQREKRKKPRTPRKEPPRAQKKKPLERATPLPPPPVVTAALDDLDEEVAKRFVVDFWHALSPPPSSLPLPRFSLVKSTKTAVASFNAEALGDVGGNGGVANAAGTATDSLRRLLRL